MFDNKKNVKQGRLPIFNIYTCGWSPDGQTGQGTYEPVKKATRLQLEKVGKRIIPVKVATSADFCLILDIWGNIYGFGNNEYNQLTLGLKVKDDKNQEIPQQLNEPILLFKATKNIKPVDIACTATTGFFLDEHRNIYSWGYGNTLGHGNSTKSLIHPEKIDLTFFGINQQKFGDDPFLEKLPEIVDIQTGIEHVVAITSDGGAYGWGRNYDGRLGNNTTRDVSYPFPILLPELCVGAACGMDHTVFVTSHVV